MTSKCFEISFAEYGTPLKPFSKERARVWLQGMEQSDRRMKELGISCNDPNYAGSLKDAEVADIGENYTWHTHPCGEPRPSPPDIKTTENLGKQFLCIGIGTERKTVCYDMKQNLKMVGEIGYNKTS